MRLIVGSLACLSMMALSQAMAVEPSPPAAAASAQALPATVVSRSEAPATGTPAVPISATSTPSGSPTGTPAAGMPATASAAAAGGSPDKPSMMDIDKKLRSQGYKVEIRRGGEKIYCRTEAIVGTRFDHKVCATAEEMAAMQQSASHDTDKMQTHHSNWLKGG